MSDRRDDPYARHATAPEREPPLSELVDGAVRKIVTAIVAAGALIGAGAYASGDEIEAPQYQVTATPDGRVIRLNTENGTLIACDNSGRCGILQRQSEDLDDEPPTRALPAPPAEPKAENAAVPAPAAR